MTDLRNVSPGFIHAHGHLSLLDELPCVVESMEDTPQTDARVARQRHFHTLKEH